MTIDKNKSISKKPEIIPHREVTFETAPPVESSELQKDECIPRFDKVRIYLHEIGRVPLLTADQGEIAARRIEMGSRVSGIKQAIQKRGGLVIAARYFRKLLTQLGNRLTLFIKSEKRSTYQKTAVFLRPLQMIHLKRVLMECLTHR